MDPASERLSLSTSAVAGSVALGKQMLRLLVTLFPAAGLASTEPSQSIRLLLKAFAIDVATAVQRARFASIIGIVAVIGGATVSTHSPVFLGEQLHQWFLDPDGDWKCVLVLWFGWHCPISSMVSMQLVSILYGFQRRLVAAGGPRLLYRAAIMKTAQTPCLAHNDQ